MEVNSIAEALKNTKYSHNEVIYFGTFEKLGIILDDQSESDEQSNHSCSICKKTLISAHLLAIHVIESHDTLFEFQSQKKPSFVCFLAECGHLSKDRQERKNHCIISHKFPVDFPEF